MFKVRVVAMSLFCMTAGALFAAGQIAQETFTSSMNILRTPGSFSVFVGELDAAKLYAELERPKGDTTKVTVLAPTDAAFNAFGHLGAVRGTPLYVPFLKFMMLPGIWTRKRLQSNRTVKTLADKQLNTKDIGKILYSIESDNGMILVTDKVLVHPDVKKQLKIQ